MRDLACFGESSVQIADASSSSSSAAAAAGGGGRGKGGVRGAAARSRVTCVYHARLASRACAVSVTWARAGGLVAGRRGAALRVVAADRASGERLCTARVRPWLFAGRRGSRTLDVAGGGGGRVAVFWDLSGARFGAGPEPLGGFYVAVVCGGEMALLLGDMPTEAFRRTGAGGRPAAGDAVLVARTEHVVGSKVFAATAQLCGGGRRHDVAIECDTAVAGDDDPCLEIRVDGRPAVRVKRLPWKFRGNQTVLVDGMPVEVFWDVHGWLFGGGGGAMAGNAVFMFQTCQAREKPVPWAYSQIFGEPQLQGQDFSLIIHAWKVE
ncbi:hypothetical protein U9M48_012109 [Paspalum notatum var. saurae]|uniref:DUF868 family protein n=1 Tax=Paspalum notatum var. saurae TaxID=547442 RepID=A0AAQ3WI87_PASNO